MRAATEVFFEEDRAKVLAVEADRRAWREAREQERHPMRCFHLPRDRAAKPRPGTGPSSSPERV